MKYIVLTITLLLCVVMGVKAEVDPNFHIYLCFGQSNMEGNAQWEAQDVGVDSRFQMLATCNFSSPQRSMGNWYTAECPIVSPVGKLGPTDYFGRTMVEKLPDKKIGVVAVAMGGSPIEMFDKDLYLQKYQDNYNEWWAQIARNYYGENPYGRIIEMAKKAQKVGVIKGILLHQGESNCGDPNWPNMVKKIYNDMLSDLGLHATDVPLYAGEVEYTGVGAQSGGCAGHNTQVRRLPSVIPTAHVVSAKDIPGNGKDPWHFSAQGYRIFGMRYAQKVLSVSYGIQIEVVAPEVPKTGKEFDKRFTNLETIGSTSFAIVNETEGNAFFCSSDQNLGYDSYTNAFLDTNAGYQFTLEESSVNDCWLLRLMTPINQPYSVWGGWAPGYLNGFSTVADCSFILGLNNQNGQDVENGAVWEIEYAENQGFSLKNRYTGKYLHDACSAKYDEPKYFTFCTLKTATTGIEDVRRHQTTSGSNVYTLDGRRVNPENLRPGLYIKDGKKVLIK